MKGWKNGDVVPEAVLRRLSGRLSRHRVSIINNEWAQSILDRTGDVAQFVRFKDGSAGILLRPNPTRYQLAHELKHYEHWRSDKPGYGKLSRLAREEFVYKALRSGKRWRRLTAEEQEHARQHIAYFRILFGTRPLVEGD